MAYIYLLCFSVHPKTNVKLGYLDKNRVTCFSISYFTISFTFSVLLSYPATICWCVLCHGVKSIKTLWRILNSSFHYELNSIVAIDIFLFHSLNTFQVPWIYYYLIFSCLYKTSHHIFPCYCSFIHRSFMTPTVAEPFCFLIR